jgi:hypothetical protein
MNTNHSLRQLLRFDAALCFACGLPGILAPQWLANFLLPRDASILGFATTDVMTELGIALAIYAVVLVTKSWAEPISRRFVAFTAAADLLWVIGTLALVAAAGSAFSTWGLAAVLLVGVDTALLGLFKQRALRKAGHLDHAQAI